MTPDPLSSIVAMLDDALARTDKLTAQADALGIANFAGRLDHVACLIAEAAATASKLRNERDAAARRVGADGTVADALSAAAAVRGPHLPRVVPPGGKRPKVRKR